jgi:secondary thiamine-phosphate synthase enzyme
MTTLSIRSTAHNQMIDITEDVRQHVRASGVRQGMVLLFVPHTTAAVTINENADPDVTRDMLLGLSTISPNDPHYHHMEGNSDAHIKSSLVGVDQLIPIKGGDLVLGTWQGIYFCEFDGPRNRHLHIVIHST